MIITKYTNKKCPRCGHLHISEDHSCEKCLFEFIDVEPLENYARWM